MARNGVFTVVKTFRHCTLPVNSSDQRVINEVTENIRHLGLTSGRVLKGHGRIVNWTAGGVRQDQVDRTCFDVDVVFRIAKK